MDLEDTPQQAAFRARVRAWLDAHRDEAPVGRGERAGSRAQADVDARRRWQRALVEGGLAGVTWPVEHGGQGLGPTEQVIAEQEIARAGVEGVLDVVGVGILGPTLIAHGSPAQQARYLPALLRADEVWCQLFSEPAAGSDLAAVRTRARRLDDGGWAIDGQKAWTTNAQIAAHGMLLARSDAAKPKHAGLTMLVVPMDAPGVTVRPLRQISGAAEFNEVFFDDVRVAADAAVGAIDDGWSVARTTLMFERLALGLGTIALGYREQRFARALAAIDGVAEDPVVRRRLGEVAVELLALRFSGYRTLSALQRGQVPGPEAALAKITLVGAGVAAAELVADVVGPDALAHGSEWAAMTSYLPGLRSAGGTEEILRTLVGERVLGLAPEPRVDLGVPFDELLGRRGRGAADA